MQENLFVSGHTACAGCGQSMAARIVLNAAGSNTIVTNATGCLEVFSTGFPHTSWCVPWIHSLFENSAAVASGVEVALRHLGKKDKINVIAQGGDGGTADIGLQALSGMLERGQDILYVMYDNEAYMNTGIQRSGMTPAYASTTTTPAGKLSLGNPRPKKTMAAICAAHNIPYVGTASVGYIRDLERKVKKAFSIKGPKFLHIFVPCPLGWRHGADLTDKVGKLVVETGLFPIVEYENGKLVNTMKLKELKPIEEFLKIQGRFKHLMKDAPEVKEVLEYLNGIVADNIEKYDILKK
ncbi:MAG: thiamine pyrophosphate-dependent enzyme [Candidatus Saelkia tenebricola]|nr:thiamine pyrophosphate-dependent enzyme [Candidatus Saelkia tenebricola]